MKRILTLLALVLCVSTAEAHPLLDSLVTEGNRAYLYSRRDIILDCAKALEKAIPDYATSVNDSLEYTSAMLKLYGNFHYEYASLDPASFHKAACYYDSAAALNALRLSTGHLLFQEKAQLNYRLKNYGQALADIDKAIDYIDQSSIYEPGDAEWNNLAMQRAMCLARTGRLEEAISLADATVADYADTASLDYARALRMKAKILALAAERPSDALEAYKKYFDTQRAFAKECFLNMDSRAREQYWLGLRPFLADCYMLGDTDPAFLYDITLFIKGLLLHLSSVSGTGPASAEALKALSYNWRDIRSKLRPGDVAIEFISMGDPDDTRMAALVLKSTGTPAYVPLASPKIINEIAGKALESTSRRNKDALYTSAALDSAVWCPALMQQLAGAKRVYFAPDGYMHRLAIEYLPSVEGTDMYRLSSTRRLMEPRRELKASSPALLCGGIDYTSAKTDSHSTLNDSEAFDNYRGTRFSRLSQESDESRKIHAMRGNPSDSLLRGAAASESVFRALAPHFGNILVSTHGDFRETAPSPATDLKPALDDDAMSRGIIAFAGVNPHLADPNFDATRCDGLLSAREVAELDLSQCNLFTLSACQSALGKIGPDGVVGLRRGLKNAGAGALLLSLWNVNSDATALLMEKFYSGLADGLGIHDAFTAARRHLLGMTPGETRTVQRFNPATMTEETVVETMPVFNSAQFANAFILIDAI